MDSYIKTALWSHFGASLDMLEQAITACPEEVWGKDFAFQEFWYISYHTLFWLDVYLSDGLEDFKPPAPFDLSELDPTGAFPERVYTKRDLLEYLHYSRQNAKQRIATLTREKAQQFCIYGNNKGTVFDILLDNMRHVQHHSAQLYLLLRQKTNSAPNWVTRTKEEL
jgi:DinB superfamily